MRPSLVSTSLNYSDGVIKMEFSETIDFTPSGRFVLRKMFVSNLTHERLVSLSGAKNSDRLGALDSKNITIVLTEKQRVDILRFSGVEGGDGSGAQFVATAESFRDIGINFNTLAVIEIDEIEDTVLPTIKEIILNLSYGILTIHPSETIEMNTIVDSRFFE